MATHLYSSSTAIESVASQLRSELDKASAQSAAVHLPGKLNVFTDRPSRVGEQMFEKAVVARSVLKTVSTIARVPLTACVLGVPSPLLSHVRLVLIVPRPHTRLQEVSEAVRLAHSKRNIRVFLLMPVAAYADKRWDEFKSSFKWFRSFPCQARLFEAAVTLHDESWVSPVCVPSLPMGKMGFWEFIRS
jgi:hypothetical protein